MKCSEQAARERREVNDREEGTIEVYLNILAPITQGLSSNTNDGSDGSE
jgi:hypothetical protein